MGRFVSAGTSDVGSVRGNNEDRVYIDAERGIYLVVDGMGGEAAGEEAAAIAVETVRGRLERPTESPEQRVREAIALANNAIFEAASGNPAWHGMACVLTLALVEDGHAVVGHVGDSRAYQIRGGKIEKITRDHSPVGEREDAGELTEEAAMNHPRRNEVYRDVGSRPRTPDDEDFIDVNTVAVPPDSALLLCSDGLSDVVPARRILQAVEENASDCEAAVKTLVRAAVADGKDNVSVVLVEGDQFAQSVRAPVAAPVIEKAMEQAARPLSGRSAFFLYGLAIGLITWAGSAWLKPAKTVAAPAGRVIRVAATGGEYASVLEAVQSAGEHDVVELAPGNYPEKVLMRNGLTIRASNPGTAHLTSIKADGIQDASVQGVAVGEDGIVVHSSNLRLEGIVCACDIRFDGVSTGSFTGSAVKGSIVLKDSASPEISRNYIDGNIEFGSTGATKLASNGVTGELVLPTTVPAAAISALLDANIFRAGRKAIRVSHE